MTVFMTRSTPDPTWIPIIVNCFLKARIKLSRYIQGDYYLFVLRNRPLLWLCILGLGSISRILLGCKIVRKLLLLYHLFLLAAKEKL